MSATVTLAQNDHREVLLLPIVTRNGILLAIIRKEESKTLKWLVVLERNCSRVCADEEWILSKVKAIESLSEQL
jgi:hypothetical protein